MMKKVWISLFLSASVISFGVVSADAGFLKGETAGRVISAVQKMAQAKAQSKTSSPKTESTAPVRVSSDGKTPIIEVGLLSGQAEATVRCLTDGDVLVNGKKWQTFKKGETVTAKRDGSHIVLRGKKSNGTVELRGSNDSANFSVKGNSYRGSVKLVPSAYTGGVTVVNAVPMEQYLMGVVPYEVSPSWHTDALKAQAVAARTYAMYHKDGYRKAGYDVTDDTRSQVYRGVAAEAASTNKAVLDTVGEIVTYGGKPIDAVFHANGGGYTENSENVWGSNTPYLRGVKEESSPTVNKAWTQTVSLDSFQNAVGSGKLKKIELSKLKKGPMNVKDRGVSGRVKSVTIEGSNGRKTLTGDRMQSLFGLSSTLFDLEVKGKNVIITGYGNGHGLGLSQWGAEAMAAKNGNGKDYYKTILTHYFTGTKVEKIY